MNRPTNMAGLQAIGNQMQKHMAAAMPRFLKGGEDRMLRCLYTCCQTNPALLDCAPKSLFGAVLQVAQLGLELGGPTGQAYLIPFKGAATLIIGYKGFIALAQRHPKTKRVTPRIVREGDVLQIEYGAKQKLVHVPDLTRVGTAPAIGYYAVWEGDNGALDFEFMTKAECEQHRDRYALSKGKGPWVSQFDEMSMKTCIRKLSKRLPINVELSTAASLDEMAEQGIDQSLSAAVVIESDVPHDSPEQLERDIAEAEAREQDGK